MKSANIKKTLLLAIGGVFVWWAWKSPAQDTAAISASMQMPYAVTQVLELEQAKIGDSTVIAYINNSGTSFNLTAAQIVFLRQQGVSDAVITAMLTQPRTSIPAASAPAVAPAPQPAPAPQYSSAQYTSAPQYAPPQYASATSTADTTDPTIIAQPPVTYVQTAPTSYYYGSYYYPYSSYAWYGWPFCWTWYGGGWHWGWRGGSVGWRGGWGWHGSWGGGWHGGWGGRGGWGGGFHGGFHGGGRR